MRVIINIVFVSVLECHGPLGMASGVVADAQISASSRYSANHAAIQGRLHFQYSLKTGAWSARTNDTNQWLQIDLIGQYIVTRVATQGRNSYYQWVTKYKLQYSNDTASFHYYKEPGKGTDKVKLIKVYYKRAVQFLFLLTGEVNPNQLSKRTLNFYIVKNLTWVLVTLF